MSFKKITKQTYAFHLKERLNYLILRKEISISFTSFHEHASTYAFAIVIRELYIWILTRQKSSGAEGERLKEATNINKSLSTLGYVF